jgi:hypothetical protein
VGILYNLDVVDRATTDDRSHCTQKREIRHLHTHFYNKNNDYVDDTLFGLQCFDSRLGGVAAIIIAHTRGTILLL